MEALVSELNRLPTIGRRSAERLAFHLLSSDLEDAQALSRSILEMRERIGFCQQCHNIAEGELCAICRDGRRDPSTICVVEDPRDVLAFEETGAFHGLYHVLGGRLSPVKGVTPEKLHIHELLERLKSGAARELILATSPSVDGDATALYIRNLAQARVELITRIGLGVSVGSSLDTTDSITIQRSLEGRRGMH